MPSVDLEVAIIGTGFSGIAAARELQQAGITDIQLFESGDDIGGTWRDNRYPGCACDVPSMLYSLSWAPNPAWSRVYSPSEEIHAYMKRVVQDLGLTERVRLNTPVLSMVWEDGAWNLSLPNDECVRARYAVLGIGALRDPVIPNIPGVQTFHGPAMHTARWDPTVDLQDKHIAIVGTGASAIQVLPAIAPRAASVTVYQRTPPWVMPRGDRAFRSWEHALFRLPGVMPALRLSTFVRTEAMYHGVFGPRRPLGRIARWSLTRHAKQGSGDLPGVIPDYDVGCKRVLLSDDWYPALARDNVTLVNGGVQSITETGLVSGDEERNADVILWCTGFRVDRPLGRLTIQDADGNDVSKRWGTRPTAHLGITLPRAPNLFAMLGPNTALGHSSVVVMIEAQARYLAQAVGWSNKTGRRVEVRQDAHDAFVQEVDRKHKALVWQSGGCRSWYQSETGENFTIWPGSAWSYIRRLSRFDPTVLR